MNERIKHLRKDILKLSQKDFSDKLGLSENFVWMIEKGNRVPSDRTISDICRIFDIQEDWLRHGLEPMREQSPGKKRLPNWSALFCPVPATSRRPLSA